MINLKLAQYNEKGEFEKFLELGDDFGYCGKSIILKSRSKFIDGSESSSWPFSWRDAEDEGIYKLDEKDPFNRFDGLFNRSTYGNGRFILIKGFIHEDIEFWEGDLITETKEWLRLNESITYSCCYGANAIGLIHDFGSSNHEYEFTKPRYNLFENPELWSKIK